MCVVQGWDLSGEEGRPGGLGEGRGGQFCLWWVGRFVVEYMYFQTEAQQDAFPCSHVECNSWDYSSVSGMQNSE